MPREHSLLLLRFGQEGLTDVVRPASATPVRLRVTAGADGVEAVIKDDGARGGGEDGPAEGFGLRSLRSRAESLGGRFDAGPDEEGFRVGISLPRASSTTAAAGGSA